MDDLYSPMDGSVVSVASTVNEVDEAMEISHVSMNISHEETISTTPHAETTSTSTPIKAKKPTKAKECTYTCNGCTYKTTKQYNLKRHQMKHTGVKMRCNTCMAEYAEKYDLEVHIKSVHEHEPCVCPHCGKLFTSRSGLHYHKLTVHFNSKRYKCATCDLGFMDKEKLRCHVADHNNIKLYKCDKCKKEFKYKSCLNRHKCKNDKPSTVYKCVHCQSEFRRSDTLKEHVATKHDLTKHITCACGKNFKWRQSYARHKKDCFSEWVDWRDLKYIPPKEVLLEIAGSPQKIIVQLWLQDCFAILVKEIWSSVFFVNNRVNNGHVTSFWNAHVTI